MRDLTVWGTCWAESKVIDFPVIIIHLRKGAWLLPTMELLNLEKIELKEARLMQQWFDYRERYDWRREELGDSICLTG